MSDKRRIARKRTFLAAYATLDADGSSTPCLVRDLSRTGARLTIGGHSDLPQFFDLHINGRDQIWRVETVWRRGAEIGVRLLVKAPARLRPAGRPPVHHPEVFVARAIHGDAAAVGG